MAILAPNHKPGRRRGGGGFGQSFERHAEKNLEHGANILPLQCRIERTVRKANRRLFGLQAHLRDLPKQPKKTRRLEIRVRQNFHNRNKSLGKRTFHRSTLLIREERGSPPVRFGERSGLTGAKPIHGTSENLRLKLFNHFLPLPASSFRSCHTTERSNRVGPRGCMEHGDRRPPPREIKLSGDDEQNGVTQHTLRDKTGPSSSGTKREKKNQRLPRTGFNTTSEGGNQTSQWARVTLDIDSIGHPTWCVSGLRYQRGPAAAGITWVRHSTTSEASNHDRGWRSGGVMSTGTCIEIALKRRRSRNEASKKLWSGFRQQNYGQKVAPKRTVWEASD
ncbi:hypothetical protein BJ322DRAFT_1021326 [Thelephora terrestris]|uniref:Uncharacterized protein n=1 Tax=Thelephora terrestris TaxID=56493 RepID=A0A9P6HD85_9AGAM|nr:hypothetical protein BJ322DRAFT_1021326 [Thelephora terrestris]